MNVYSAISVNKWKTWLIMVFFIIFITTISYVFAKALNYGLELAVFALILSGFMSFFSYYYSDKMILGLSRAKQISKTDNPRLFNTVENLCLAAGLPTPKIYIINDNSPNAFATGRDPKNAVICVTTGILEKLNKVELEGVISHELSHIKNYDIRLMGIVTILVGFIAILADFFLRSLWIRNYDDEDRKSAQNYLLLIGLVFALLSPIIATLIQLAVSRKREFLADASGVLLTRYPEGLASALEKISKDPNPLKTANNATAHLFIANPFKNKSVENWLSNLFNTHPPIEERIRILRSM